MLVLSRRQCQEICLPALGVTIRVQRIGRQVVSLAVDAPAHIRVLRAELCSAERFASDEEAVSDTIMRNLVSRALPR